LIAGGAALFALFPQAYASSFSGFYLPFIVALWLLMFRGIALELRDHFSSELWHEFWDAAFSLSSALLIVVFGVTLGNLLRGVPLGPAGYFQGTFAFLLNPYALFVAAFALCTLALHGAAFLAMRVDGEPGAKAMRAVAHLWWAVGAFYAAATVLTFFVHAPLGRSWLFAMPVFSVAALIALRRFARKGHAVAAFAASSFFIATLLIASAGTLFPYLLPAYPAGRGGISIFEAAPSAAALICALTVTIGGIVLVTIYGSAVWWRMGGKIRVE
jgi:cytochrome d ubiquinol oxidase subunit II